MQWKYNENTNTSKNTNTNIASRTKVSTQTYQEYNENAKDGMNATNFENITQISSNIQFHFRYFECSDIFHITYYVLRHMT